MNKKMDQMKKMSWIILTVIPCIWRNDDYFDYGHEEDLSSSHWERMQKPPEPQLLQRSMDPEAMLRIAKMNMRNCTELFG
mmetsp:Transcript_14713/g.20795  ORF Transcript_14713/g.20795 Transcript_14713/m.20795 type:complete len:80 (+) Transcript_14713:364-603(+)